MLNAMEYAIGAGPFLLGDDFTMADVIFGGALRWMLGTGLLEKRPIFTEYAERLSARPAAQRSLAKNEAVREQHGIPPRG